MIEKRATIQSDLHLPGVAASCSPVCHHLQIERFRVSKADLAIVRPARPRQKFRVFMSITKEEKQRLIQEFGQGDNDTGSPQVQIAVLTHHIQTLTAHLKGHQKDHASRRGSAGNGRPPTSFAGLSQGKDARTVRGDHWPPEYSKVITFRISVVFVECDAFFVSVLSLPSRCVAIWWNANPFVGRLIRPMSPRSGFPDCWLKFLLLTAAAGLSRIAATWGDFGVVGNCRRCCWSHVRVC